MSVYFRSQLWWLPFTARMLLLLLWACGKATNDVGIWVVLGNQKAKRCWDPNMPFEGSPLTCDGKSTGRFHLLPTILQLTTKPLTHGPLGYTCLNYSRPNDIVQQRYKRLK